MNEYLLFVDDIFWHQIEGAAMAFIGDYGLKKLVTFPFVTSVMAPKKSIIAIIDFFAFGFC